MAASKSYRDYVLEELGKVTAVRARAMFGGYGIYAHDAMFALISSEDILYLKVDDVSRPTYEAVEMPQFHKMPYFQLPIEVLENDEQLESWVKTSVDIAVRTKKPKKKKS